MGTEKSLRERLRQIAPKTGNKPIVHESQLSAEEARGKQTLAASRHAFEKMEGELTEILMREAAENGKSSYLLYAKNHVDNFDQEVALVALIQEYCEKLTLFTEVSYIEKQRNTLDNGLTIRIFW